MDNWIPYRQMHSTLIQVFERVEHLNQGCLLTKSKADVITL